MNIITKEIYNNLELLTEDLQTWNGNSQVFHQLIEEVKPQRIIELGTWKGGSAINMGNYCKKNNYATEIYCVDTFLGALEFWDHLKGTSERNLLQKNGYPQIYYQFLSNVVHNGLEDYILPFPNTSVIAGRFFKNNNITAKLIYIDASHDYEDVLIDLNLYWELVESGGIMFGDDFNAWQGVGDAVMKFAGDNDLRMEVRENNFWIIRK